MKRPYSEDIFETIAEFDLEEEGFELESSTFDGENSDLDSLGKVCRGFEIDSADYFKWVQRSLNRLLGLKLAINGKDSDEYRQALRRFQQKHGLRQTGQVDVDTQNKIILENEKKTPYSGDAYVKWLQTALNKNGARVSVDGDMGLMTRQAVKTFQQQRTPDLCVDGYVGAKTELRLIKAGGGLPPEHVNPAPGLAVPQGVNTPLPLSGVGYYSAHRSTSRQYGLPDTIRALQAIAAMWHRAHPQGPRIGISDISFQGGGLMRPHVSHQKGVDVDIRLMRNDGREEPVVYQSSSYSRSLTQELVNLIRANGVLRVQYIFFNDPQVTGVSKWRGHDNHLHVRFFLSSNSTTPTATPPGASTTSTPSSKPGTTQTSPTSGAKVTDREVGETLAMAAKKVPGLGITLEELLLRHKADSGDIPIEVLLAFIHFEAGTRLFDDATAGKWNEKYQKYIPSFYELGVFQTPAGAHGCIRESGNKRCKYEPPGYNVESSQFGKGWYRLKRTYPTKDDWRDPTTQVRIGLWDLNSTGERVAKSCLELFPSKRSEWYLRMAVLYSFSKGAGWTRAFLSKYKNELLALPESQRWDFLRGKPAYLKGRGTKTFDPENVDKKMALAAKLRAARGTSIT